MEDRLKQRIAQVLDRRCESLKLSEDVSWSPEQILAHAHLGLTDPSKLSPEQIRGLSYALILTYAQMGISAD